MAQATRERREKKTLKSLILPFKFKSAPSIKPNATHLKMEKKKKENCVCDENFFFSIAACFFLMGREKEKCTKK